MNVRRLAAIDMYGSRGAPRRARIIFIEFVSAAVGITLLGLWLVGRASGLEGWLVAVWIVGAGFNYVVLTVHAMALRGPGELSEELAGVDRVREIRRYGVLQLWVLVPFSLGLWSLVGLLSTPSS